ncbi:MAG: ShlB/FhaC/HecB family hemolysin secretion/activation protein, partial [Microcystaceae cyanobacterium]
MSNLCKHLLYVSLIIIGMCLNASTGQAQSITDDQNSQILENCPSAPESQRFLVKEIYILGNTILKAETSALAESLENQQLTLEQLICLRTAITELYVKRGYITSGAFLPNNQDITDGIVQIQVVEGEIERIEIQGLKRIKDYYIRSRLERITQTPLNQKKLQDGLALLQLDPLIQTIQAELTTGSTSGKSVLLVNLEEAKALSLEISTDNYRPPNIGSYEGTIALSHGNVLGWGDRFSGEYSITEGLDLYNFGYRVPINPMDGQIGVTYYNTDSQITEDLFDVFDIRNQTQTFSAEYRQPIYRSPQTEWTLGLNLDIRSNRSSLEGVSFCFSQPCRNGKTKITVLRFSQEWLNRAPSQVLAARSQFNFGINAFDATVIDIEPNPEFFSWLGQFQMVNRFDNNWLLLGRFYAQIAGDPLPIIEQFSLGGIDTVRGYGQNQIVTDNALLGSLELRIPLTQDPSILQLTPFIEGGTGWNNLLPNPDPATLGAVGVGLRWLVIKDLTIRLDYGVPLVSVDNRGDSLQEQGFY